MELENLKSGWKNIDFERKSEIELEQMTLLKNHPILHKIRIKILIESIALCLLLLVYYDWFDGHQKPLYANLLLVLSILARIGNNIFGYWGLLRSLKSYFLLPIKMLLFRVKFVSLL